MAYDTGNDKAVGDKVRDEDNSPYPRHSISCSLAVCGFGSKCIGPNLENFLSSAHFADISRYWRFRLSRKYLTNYMQFLIVFGSILLILFILLFLGWTFSTTKEWQDRYW